MEKFQDKLKLRNLMRERLKTLSIMDRENKSSAISKLIKNVPIKPEETGVYAALPEEVDWSLEFADEVFLYAGFKDKKQIAFYPCSKGNLKVCVWNKQTFKIPPLDQEVTPKVLLIPGMAMSVKGERLGRGGGFYDRYLEHFTGLKIGLTFDCCLVESLPTESHDVQMDWIVTESGIIKIRR